jgi:hypothetical protein
MVEVPRTGIRRKTPRDKLRQAYRSGRQTTSGHDEAGGKKTNETNVPPKGAVL